MLKQNLIIYNRITSVRYVETNLHNYIQSKYGKLEQKELKK